MEIGEIKGTAEWFGTFTMVAGAPLGELAGSRVDMLPWKEGGPLILASPEDGKVWQMQPLDMHARAVIQQSRAAGAKAIVSVVAGEGTRVVVRTQIFPRSVQFPVSSPLVVLVTEAIEATIPEWAREQGIVSFLEREFLAGDVAYSQMGEDDDSRAFRLIGSRFLLFCRIGKLGHPQTTKLERKRRDVDSDRISLMRGAIRFEDARLATTQLTSIRDLTAQLQSEDDSFFGMWKVYQDLSETLLEQQTQEAGTLTYQQVSTVWENGLPIFVFSLSKPPHPAFLNDGIEVELVQDESEDQFRRKRSSLGQVLSRKRTLELRVSARTKIGEDIPAKGVLRISQSGDRVMLDRRKNALQLLREQQTALPTLSQLLEQGDAPVAQPRRWKPINDRVRRILPNPTDQQQDALDVALNTPDIALIQGPPGTGKTSVIRALMTRISQLREDLIKSHTGSGGVIDTAAVLITSEQHDAVEHAVDGVDAGGLPVYRYSRRRDENRLEERELNRWVAERISSCREHLRQHGITPARILARNAERVVLRWREAESQEEKRVCLDELSALCRTAIPPAMLARLMSAIDKLNPPVHSGPSDSDFERRIQDRFQTILSAQPQTSADYESNGLINTGRLLAFIERNSDILRRPIPELLQKAAQGENPFPDSDGAWGSMLAGLATDPQDDMRVSDAQDSGTNELLSDVIENLRNRASAGGDGIYDAVEAFAEELEDPAARNTMIQKYAQVVASTCQQSVSKAYEDGNPEFEFVIVDEAARANPLDLLIPLSRGKRIVLVGDHKQLPQMLEPDVVEAYRALRPGFDDQLLQKSLFERLFELFQNAEKNGAPRRTAMLTDDFRMHPSISRLVSDLFYGGAVHATCKAEDRAHRLSRYGSGPFCWIDVPIQHGKEEGVQTKRRQCEAQILVEELQSILAADDKTTVGVITFYERQAALLTSLCDTLPYDWQYRVRIGTVDAFQGREFDVVLLSTVRSNRESSLRRRVGFLAYSNRLCVAFSRARKLLVTVGDSETIAGSESDPVIPQFQTLLSACRGSEGTYVRR
jgi:hypothetical protein